MKPNPLGQAIEPARRDSRGPKLDPIPRMQSWEAAVALVQRSTNILLICHVSPDGDAIGSLLGLGLGLRILGKNPTMACESNPPPKYGFLPGFELIVNRSDSRTFDLVIGLDCSDRSRLGSVYEPLLLAGIPILNIDHHVTNDHFGDVNVVDPTAASVAEMIVSLLDHLGLPVDQTTGDASETGALRTGIATCLLTGIVTDTLGFRTSNVTAQVMKTSSRLLEAGASLPQITQRVFNQRPVAELGLLAQGLSRMQVEDGLAWSEITLSDRAAWGQSDDSNAGLVAMLVHTQEVHIAAVFTEKEDNQVEVSFRADPGFDVADLALRLGGGGHPAASGCTIEGSLEAAKARVIPMLRAVLEEQRNAQRA